ncbi:MAG: hypothetical protein ACI85Q_002072 [Salibacteraceae bacterium]|jgi:hypothetical protein
MYIGVHFLTEEPTSDNEFRLHVREYLSSDQSLVGGEHFTIFKIYPNPASNYIQIERMANAKDESFTLYDLSGKVVLKTLLNSNIQTIEVSSLVRGNYTYVIDEYTGKIILK